MQTTTKPSRFRSMIGLATLLVFGVTSWGDQACVSTDMRFRVDTEQSHTFITSVLAENESH